MTSSLKKIFKVLALSTALATAAQAAQVNVNYYTGFMPAGDGSPFSSLVASDTAPNIRFAMDSWWNWHPWGLGAFGAQMKGTLRVKVAGNYPIALTSDDGSSLYVDGKMVLDNGGDHAQKTVLTILNLAAGYHEFVVNCWQNGFGASGVDLALPNGVEFGDANAPDAGLLLQQLLVDVTGGGPGRSLENKVRTAQTHYAIADIQTTCAVLADFVREVSAQTGKKKLTAYQGATFTSDARSIMAAINCK